MSIAEIIALIAGLGGLATAISTALKYRADAETARAELERSAKRDELDKLRAIIDDLEERNEKLYNRVQSLETALEAERCKRRELEEVVMAKDARIAELEAKVRVLEAQLEELEQTPRTRNKKV